MAIFRYKATNLDKQRVEGLIEADSDYEASEILSEKNFSLVSLKKESSSFDSRRFFNLINKVKRKDLVIFFRQFSVMVSANVDLVHSLRILVEQTENIRLKIVVSEIADEIDSGSRLSESLAKRPEIFTDFFVNVIKSGETSGKLDEVLSYLADEVEKDYDMVSKVKSAMIYPAFIFLGLVGVGALMMVVVIPKLTDILKEGDVELPITTRILITTTDFFANFWWLLAIIIAALAVGTIMFAKTEVGRNKLDYFILKLPVFGKLLQMIFLVRFMRTMHTLIVGGVTITKSLGICSEVVGNKVYKNIILETVKEVEDGNTISSVFQDKKEIPKMVTQIISVGEKTGKLDIILERISSFYAREINNITNNLMVLLEPIILVVMGIAVGIMVSGIILPMYNMASAI